MLRRLLGNNGRTIQPFLRQCGSEVVVNRSIVTTPAIMAQPVITIDNMNPHVKKLEYAVRGPLVIRATAIERELKEVS